MNQIVSQSSEETKRRFEERAEARIAGAGQESKEENWRNNSNQKWNAI